MENDQSHIPIKVLIVEDSEDKATLEVLELYRGGFYPFFELVNNPKAIETALNCGDKDSYYWIFTKDPSVQAFTDLMNRALDKPAEQVKVTGEDGGPVVFKWKE